MHVLWWVFWIGLVVVVFATVRPVPKKQGTLGDRALDVQRRRYAAGQMPTEEYEQRKAVLERDRPGKVPRQPAHQHH